VPNSSYRLPLSYVHLHANKITFIEKSLRTIPYPSYSFIELNGRQR